MWGVPQAAGRRQLALIPAGLPRPEQVIPEAPPAIPAEEAPEQDAHRRAGRQPEPGRSLAVVVGGQRPEQGRILERTAPA
jgi:hypothetical protein